MAYRSAVNPAGSSSSSGPTPFSPTSSTPVASTSRTLSPSLSPSPLPATARPVRPRKPATGTTASASASSAASTSKGKGKAKAGANGSTSATTCRAVDRWDEPCADGVRTKWWCRVHELEEKVVREEFYRCTTELTALPSRDLCLSPTLITSCDDLDQLSTWESAARSKLELADKATRCRKYHHAHFCAVKGTAGADGELCSKQAAGGLKKAAEGLALAVAVLNRRSHTLVLASEDASWLLSPPPLCPPCPSPPSSASLRIPCAPSLQTESEEPDPIVAHDKMKRAELLELLSLTGSHASFIRDCRRSVERVRIIECLFRRLISRDETLLVRAYRGGHDHVLRFFEDPACCTLAELARVWAALQQTDVGSIKEAIMDAFRAIKWEESGAGETEEGEEGMGLQLLGGWTYKVQLGREMDRTEWGHLYDLCGCPGCALRCCVSFPEWAKTRRLTVVPHGTRPPPYLYWGDSKEPDAARIFRALDVVKCSEERGMSESEIRRVAGGFVGAKGKGVFVERQERNWLFIKISITHPKSLSILQALTSSHAVVVQRRRSSGTSRSTFAVPSPSHLWFSRHRSAPSKAELRHQSWQTDPDAFGPGNSKEALILSTIDSLGTPEVEQGMQAFVDTYEILVLDGFGRDGEGTGLSAVNWVARTFEQFEAEVGQTLLGACGCRDVKAALEWGEAESYRKGDLLFDFKAVGSGKGKNKGGEGGEGGKKKAKEKGVDGTAAMLDSLRDDALAFKLSRSLFR